MRKGTQAQGTIQDAGRIDVRVAVHHSVSRELRILEPRNHAEYAPLLGEGEIRLEADEIAAAAVGVLKAQLDGGPRTLSRARIHQPDGLHGAMARCIEPPARNLFNGLAGAEQLPRFEIFCNDSVCRQQLCNEILVFLLREWSVQVVALAGILVSTLAEQHVLIKRIRHHNGRRRIVERQMLGTRETFYAGSKRIPGQRAGGNNGGTRGGDDILRSVGRTKHEQAVVPDIQDLALAAADQRRCLDRFRDDVGKRRSIHRKSTSCGHRRTIGCCQHLGTERIQFVFQHAGSAFELRTL